MYFILVRMLSLYLISNYAFILKCIALHIAGILAEIRFMIA